MYTCARCSVHACGQAEPEKLPENCPMRNKLLMGNALETYSLQENHDFAEGCFKDRILQRKARTLIFQRPQCFYRIETILSPTWLVEAVPPKSGVRQVPSTSAVSTAFSTRSPKSS